MGKHPSQATFPHFERQVYFSLCAVSQCSTQCLPSFQVVATWRAGELMHQYLRVCLCFEISTVRVLEDFLKYLSLLQNPAPQLLQLKLLTTRRLLEEALRFCVWISKSLDLSRGFFRSTSMGRRRQRPDLMHSDHTQRPRAEVIGFRKCTTENSCPASRIASLVLDSTL